MKKLYTIWMIIIFVITFFMLFPFYYVFLQNKKWHRLAHNLTKIWAWVIMKCGLISIEAVFEAKIEPKKKYIYTPNHFSYFDIPLISYLTPGYYKFIGKKSLGEIPVFGYMFRNLYITVNRESKTNAYKTLLRAVDTLNQGIGLVVYPEGGILSPGPELAAFKDGPFRMAVESNTEIIPVTIPFNWIFLPDNTWIINRRKLKIIYHRPLKPGANSQEEVERLKKECFKIISDRLKKELESENR
ncbi:1-acyl-sn-glycerol-3-phosphate acyltransferase [Hyphobacterium sp. CCMP332]|nr:1-acyl-sn-glycerol-3-phosphate acyltransferase [Hyphobacterium sp. CCMP332]